MQDQGEEEMQEAPAEDKYLASTRKTRSKVLRSHSKEMTENWKNVLQILPILDGKPPDAPIKLSDEMVNKTILKIQKSDITRYVIDLALTKIQKSVLNEIVPSFWQNFLPENTPQNDREGFLRHYHAMSKLEKAFDTYRPTFAMLKRLDCSDIRVEFNAILHGFLLAKLPPGYDTVLNQYFNLSFNVYCKHKRDRHDDSVEEGLYCSGCGVETEVCDCEEILRLFDTVNFMMMELRLMERMAGEKLRAITYNRIVTHVQETCRGSFQSHLSELEAWLESVVFCWVRRVYGDDDNAREHMNHCYSKLSFFLCETYAKCRIEELFNIIIEFPESTPALEDLKLCLQRTDLRGYLTRKLGLVLRTRLLHPGANTTDILVTYVDAIRALRLLDPSGVLLETVTAPVRQYLRQREDMVRCVVTSLTDDGPSELAEELAQSKKVFDEDADSDDDMQNWKTWQPPPIDADPAQSGQSRRTSDIISMLVSVYGSKEVFVNEYRILLADRLLSQFNYNTEKDLRHLELLKRRFGDSQLHYCEVMLKDIHDSRRMNVHLHSDPCFNVMEKEFPCTAVILSAQFWPPFKEETLELPPVVKEHLENYTSAFETLKGNRTLSWKPHLGYVNLDIELKDRKLNLSVSPIHATIIMHFENQSTWTINDLSHAMKMSGTMLRRKISYWQGQGILREQNPDVFVLVEEGSTRSGPSGKILDPVSLEDEEAESALASAHEQREGELQVFWSYIVGMLTNLDSLPLERIHQMLKMFASQGPSAVECSQQELRHFLDRKVREHQLLFSGGLYKLPKP